MGRRISADEAKDLMDQDGYVYVDVRSVPEFAAGHPTGAYNVPLLHMGPQGMAPNPQFMAAMEKAFAKDAKLIVACKGGGRSAQAAAMLEASGFTNVVDQRAGFEGHAEPGWRPKGLPVSTQAEAGRDWDAIAAKTKP
jgi:rhodanese-related sulfurtransferase